MLLYLLIYIFCTVKCFIFECIIIYKFMSCHIIFNGSMSWILCIYNMTITYNQQTNTNILMHSNNFPCHFVIRKYIYMCKCNMHTGQHCFVVVVFIYLECITFISINHIIYLTFVYQIFFLYWYIISYFTNLIPDITYLIEYDDICLVTF